MSTKKHLFTIKEICTIGVFTALICVFAQISIPMPFGVPITLQTFIIMLIGIALGPKNGTVATALYVVVGVIGLPVFAGFSGGPQVAFGVTGGFIMSFPLMSLLAGLGASRQKAVWLWLGLVLGVIVNYTVGVAYFCIISKASVATAIAACVLPFLATDVAKVVLVGVVGKKCRTLLMRAGLAAKAS